MRSGPGVLFFVHQHDQRKDQSHCWYEVVDEPLVDGFPVPVRYAAQHIGVGLQLIPGLLHHLWQVRRVYALQVFLKIDLASVELLLCRFPPRSIEVPLPDPVANQIEHLRLLRQLLHSNGLEAQ